MKDSLFLFLGGLDYVYTREDPPEEIDEHGFKRSNFFKHNYLYVSVETPLYNFNVHYVESGYNSGRYEFSTVVW
nr:MAG TPA: hypothetical protein [Caudoviricetes sp.]